MNNIDLVGRLTRDPELGTTRHGTKVGNIRIAVQRTRDRDTADFFTITLWEGLAESCNAHLQKGPLALATVAVAPFASLPSRSRRSPSTR